MNRASLANAGLRHVWRSALARQSLRRDVPLGPPLSIAVGLTSRCTYRCLHCQVWRTRSEEYDAAAWRTVFRQLARWMGPAHVAMAGGEPFLRTDLGDIVRAAADSGLLPSVVTNGAPQINATQVAAWPLVSLTLSIDSLQPGPHDALHQNLGAHRRVMDLAAELCAAGMASRLRVAAVLTARNADEMAPLAQWAASKGIGGFTVQPLGEPFGARHDPMWYPSSGLSLAPDQVATIVDRLLQGAQNGWPVLNPRRQLLALPRYYGDPERFIIPCTVGVTSLGIGPAGELRFCPYLPSFGAVAEGPVRDQWRGPEAARVRALTRSCTRGCSIMNCTFNPTVAERLRRWRRYLPSVLHA